MLTKGKAMFNNWLQKKLGITELQEMQDIIIVREYSLHKVQWGMHNNRWNDVAQRLSDIDDHLLETKEMLKNHAVVSEQKALESHTEVMARLGMVLTALEKAVPQYAVSPMMQPIPLATTDTGGRSKKVKTPSHVPVRTRATYSASLHFYRQILEALPEHPMKPLHYTRIAGRLKCTHGRVSGALSRLMKEGLVERMGQGLYRKSPGAGENVDAIDTSQ